MPSTADGGGPLPLGTGVDGGFTDRGGAGHRPPYDANLAGHVGDDADAVRVARAALRTVTGTTRLVFTDQVHGCDVLPVPAGLGAGIHEVGRADALVTTEPGTALAMLVADCLPVLLADSAHGVVGVAHAGRRGLAAGVLTAVVAAMVRLGARPPDLAAVIGPGICGRCYEVPPTLRDEIAAAVPGSASVTRQGTAGIELRAGARAMLAAAGVASITDDPRCTAEDPRLYSFRRDGVTGRFAGWVVRR